MRAFVLPDFERQPTLADIPTPEAGPGQVLVRVRATSVNGIDLFIASGRLQGMLAYDFPVVLGKDFAGTVEAVGSGVTDFAAGDRVFGVVSDPSPLSSRSFAEYLAMPAGPNLARIPEGVDFAAAGVLGLAGAAALQAVDAIALTAGETVLVSGATGGVGAYAVQLVAARGAIVIATAKPGGDVDFVRDLGAAHSIDYTGDVAAQVRAIRPNGVDAVLHFAGDGAQLGELFVPGGRLASTLIMSADQLPLPNARVAPVFASPDAATLDRLAAEVAAGRLKTPNPANLPARRGWAGDGGLRRRHARQRGDRQRLSRAARLVDERSMEVANGRRTAETRTARHPRASNDAAVRSTRYRSRRKPLSQPSARSTT